VAHRLPALVGEPAPSGLVDAMAVVLPVHDVLDCAPRPRSTPMRRHLVWAYRRLGLDHEADATARRYGLDLRKV
jgi:hypothetical protein